MPSDRRPDAYYETRWPGGGTQSSHSSFPGQKSPELEYYLKNLKHPYFSDPHKVPPHFAGLSLEDKRSCFEQWYHESQGTEKPVVVSTPPTPCTAPWMDSSGRWE
ncbi:uncharacterized protein I206_106086 [Kwoniella pini CBS 10737]|uniref:Uncharacterized protein n=1 Tax=Kwoniella pini CBS 10737 TaxID=1296096 RepID=A0A1B9I100_9TREE|nr:uncharacterized protein I206_04910 [Kwoniella pini CBS 10737]OCF49222.1 hypothetical protein I206_04910 [Kwoniella pini CBS 10737]